MLSSHSFSEAYSLAQALSTGRAFIAEILPMNVHMTLQQKQLWAGLACVLSVGFALYSCVPLLFPSDGDMAVAAADSGPGGGGPAEKAGGIIQSGRETGANTQVASQTDKSQTAGQSGKTGAAGKRRQKGQRRAITGAAQAAATAALRDPFTPQHETASEVASVLAANAQPQVTPEQATQLAAQAAGQGPMAGAGAAGQYAGTAPGGQPAGAAPAADGGAVVGAPAYTLPVLVLQGVASGEHGQLAILSDGTHTAAVAPGEWFGGWCLVAVGSEGAELANGSGALHLDYATF